MSTWAITVKGRLPWKGASRAADVVVVVPAILFFAPLLLLLCLVVRLSGSGPIIFRHRRIGKDGKHFDCLKFRTMVKDADIRLAALLANDPAAREEWFRDHKLRADPRITLVGNFLRRSSLDELPQFFNVLAGSMSIVGPRPIVHAEVARYGRYFDHYCTVRPGITGLWQISGRSDVSYRRRVALDVAYTRAKSLRLDMRILAMTIPSVLKAKGSY